MENRELMPYHRENQLTHRSFGYVIARFVCAECNRELAHARQYADGSRHVLVPDPSRRNRVLMKNSPNRSKLYFAQALAEIPADATTTNLRCPKHSGRMFNTQALLTATVEGRPTKPVILRA